MKAKELRELSPAELDRKLADLKKDLFNLRMQHATNQLENPIRIADVRRDIARVKTILRAEQLREEQLKEAVNK
ncbi:MAG: 50S ribosomal protein L29 [Oscillospiraceae bacterium]|nr:50S ribosomal protein L29 [Oscillospiraceae bacterium]MDR2670173.1 50S ribosomal protein L29 [Oscillospiraceae bacterium]